VSRLAPAGLADPRVERRLRHHLLDQLLETVRTCSGSSSSETGTSTTARPHPRVRLFVTSINPLGTVDNVPSYCRTDVVRRLRRSIVPDTVPADVVRSTVSPTSYCPSRKMNRPLNESRTIDCAPNPSAIPTIPADATIGVMSTPRSFNRVNRNTNQTTTITTPDTSPITVATRRRRRPSASSPPPRARRR
jgi:hypothetical protein